MIPPVLMRVEIIRLLVSQKILKSRYLQEVYRIIVVAQPIMLRNTGRKAAVILMLH